jgi:hypothetical protein
VVVVVALVALLAVLVGASLAVAAPSPQQSPTANGKGATSENYQLDFVINSSCSGESIEVTGTMHIVNHFVPVQGGSYATSYLQFINMKGVGLTTGDQYVIRLGDREVRNFVPNGSFVDGMVLTTMIVSAGSSPNVNGVLKLQWILDEDGTEKAHVAEYHLKCTGPGGPTSPPSTASATATATPTATAKAQSRP